jgi:senataxin
MSNNVNLQQLLEQLRGSPVNALDATESILATLYDYLMSVPIAPLDGLHHWFCDQATPVTFEAASFLIRLFAYSSDRVTAWKERFGEVLGGCAKCVKGLVEVKSTSRRT